MSLSTREMSAQQLSLTEELVLMLLSEESGYFHQVPGWNLNCAVVGAALADLSLLSRIDTDVQALFVVDRKRTGDPLLDSILDEIASEPQRNAQYWIERLAPRADAIIDSTLDRLVDKKVLEHHSGEFWTLARPAWRTQMLGGSSEGSAIQFVKARISKAIFENEIPSPRDVIIICLIDTCDVFRFIFPLDDEAEERIQAICKMDLIGRSIASAVTNTLAVSLARQSALAKEIPTVPLRKLIFNRRLRSGNMPALFADLAKEYGPVFQVRPPFQKPMIFLAGPKTNQWVHRRGRMYLRARDYLEGFEKVYGASGILPALDGADHFRYRKSMASAYARTRLEGQLDTMYRNAREHMAGWKVGTSLRAGAMCRMLVNAQLSPFMISVSSQDLMDDLMKFKERALIVHVMGMMPKFMLKTPGMRRRAKALEVLLERVLSVHTPAQRAEQPRDIADDLLSMHASDPQFMPESNLRFALSAPLIASVYVGDALTFALYAMVSQPELHEKIQKEADALFDKGDPRPEDFAPANIDVTHRFLMECFRMYPIVPVSMRNVMNACIVEDYRLPIGARVYIAQTAAHYMPDIFPEPEKFDVDRYLPPRSEHRSPGYAPYGLGTHTCLGSRQMELQLAVNVLMLAHHFTFEMNPPNYKLGISPLPSLKPNKKFRVRITARRRELRVTHTVPPAAAAAAG